MSGQLPKSIFSKKKYNCKVIRRFDHVYVVAQFYPWLVVFFLVWLCMIVIFENKRKYVFKTKD